MARPLRRGRNASAAGYTPPGVHGGVHDIYMGGTQETHAAVRLQHNTTLRDGMRPILRCLVLLCAALPAEPHAMWVSIGEKHIVVRFSESPITTTRPGFDTGLANRTTVSVSVKPTTASEALALTMGSEGGYHDLSAPTPASLHDPKAVALVEGNGLKGMFEEFPDTSIHFWFAAPVVTDRTDWDYIDHQSANRLQLSLRPAVACSSSAKPIVVMVRFDGKNLPGNQSVSLYDSSGASLGTVFAIEGFAKVDMPTDKLAFARTYYTEPLSSAKIDPVTGGTYHKILHGASATKMKSCYSTPSGTSVTGVVES